MKPPTFKTQASKLSQALLSDQNQTKFGKDKLPSRDTLHLKKEFSFFDGI